MYRARRVPELIEGSGFFSDFASGLKKGFTSVVQPFASAALNVGKDLAIKKLTGQGVRRRRRKLTGAAYQRALQNLAKARAARKSSTVGAGYRKRLRSRATTRGRKVRAGIRRSVLGGGFLDDVLGTVRSVASSVAPIAVGALAKRYGGSVRYPRLRLQSMRSGVPVLMEGTGVKSFLVNTGTKLAKDVLLPGTISVAKHVGKNVILPRLKQRYPWLSHLGLGVRRRRPSGRGLFLP